ncbi:phosphatase [Bacillus sp. ISL-18]|uniref:phosphatase n=1 Tax=Bacillus sp. ISL-18 TaxID=2819118 RepID=UPI001BE666AF|nr:phosphatase [Bacillus sp. ISL-18]MBT2655309.1 phosphatase [Bacillus sp. ISL-18]
MKKLVIGAIGVISGVFLYGMTLIASAIYSLYLTAPDTGGGYDTDLGVFGTALKEIGTIPLIISIILFIAGIYYLYKGMKSNTKKV